MSSSTKPSRIAATPALWVTAGVMLLGAGGGTAARAQQVTLSAADGAMIHGTWYRAAANARALIVAFHQGGANGEGEYAPIAPRLNREGYDVLVIDQRTGGDLFGGVNRTVSARGAQAGYCDAAPDLAGAVQYARASNRERVPILLWGSSYSAALVLRLAATQPEGVSAVLAFSPASGEPMAGCRGEEMSEGIRIPVLALRPRSEMERASVRDQVELFHTQGHQTFTAEPGAHGSSMLVEDRVGAPVDATWRVVLEFLRNVVEQPSQGSEHPAHTGFAGRP